MPREPSLLTAAALLAEQTGDAFWYLAEISHATLPGPLRFVTNNELVTRGGFDWEPSWFQIVLPGEDADQLTKATIEIDNVDGAILQAILAASATGPLHVKLFLATLADPTTLIGPNEFDWREVSWDAQKISGSLEPEDLLNESWPKDEFVPSKWPGLFR